MGYLLRYGQRRYGGDALKVAAPGSDALGPKLMSPVSSASGPSRGRATDAGARVPQTCQPAGLPAPAAAAGGGSQVRTSSPAPRLSPGKGVLGAAPPSSPAAAAGRGRKV